MVHVCDNYCIYDCHWCYNNEFKMCTVNYPEGEHYPFNFKYSSPQSYGEPVCGDCSLKLKELALYYVLTK